MQAFLRKVRISPKKANLVAGLVRWKAALEALDILKFAHKKAADFLYKAIKSAISNAENNEKARATDLWVKEIVVNNGEVWKRIIPSSRGRSLPIQKPTAHISVLLEKK